jgi:putative membrane protein
MKGEKHMKRTGKSILLASAILCLLSSGLLAQKLQRHTEPSNLLQEDSQMTKTKPHDDPKHSTGKMMVDHKDHEFMMKAAQGGMTEVELGQLALKQASSGDVKQFAQRMVDDHAKAGDELKGLAAGKGVMLPTVVGKKSKDQIDKLAKLSGADFDQEYMKLMMKNHSASIDLFEKEAQKGKDAETKAWAEKTLPTLREHKTMAHDVAGKVEGVKPDLKPTK